MKKVDLSYYLPLIQAVHDGDFEEFKLVVDSLKESGQIESLGRQNAEAVLSEWNINKKDGGDTRKNAVYNAMEYLISSGFSVKGTNLIPYCLHNENNRVSIKLLNLLYENGADIDAKYNGYTGLMYACSTYGGLGKVKFFLDRLADVNVLGERKENALMLFCKTYGAFYNDNKDEIEADFKIVAKDLVERTKDLSRKDKNGNTAKSLIEKHASAEYCDGLERYNCYVIVSYISNALERSQKS